MNKYTNRCIKREDKSSLLSYLLHIVLLCLIIFGYYLVVIPTIALLLSIFTIVVFVFLDN